MKIDESLTGKVEGTGMLVFFKWPTEFDTLRRLGGEGNRQFSSVLFLQPFSGWGAVDELCSMENAVSRVE